MSADKKAPATQGQSAAASAQPDSGEDIEQIMSEIEELQESIAGTTEGTETLEPKLKIVEPVVTATEDFQGAPGDASLEETLSGMKEEAPASGASILDAAIEEPVQAPEPPQEELTETDFNAILEEEERESMNNHSESQDGSLTMRLTGNMTLNLQYEYEGQEVTIGFKDNALCVQLSDGTEFKIPVARGKLANAA